MTRLLYILVVSEIIIVNLMTLDRCCRRNCSLFKLIVGLVLFSVMIVGCGMAILSRLPFYGNGNGLFVFLGFLYLLPARRIYDDDMGKIFLVLCSAWTYSLTVFSITIQIGTLVPQSAFNITVFATQTFLFLLFTPFFYRYALTYFVSILQNIQPSTYKYLKRTSLLWFFTIALSHFSFMVHVPLLRIASVLLMFCNAAATYMLLRTIIDQKNSVDTLKEIVYMDSLTGLQNRTGLQNKIAEYRSGKRPFYLIYLDLDHFKSINDQYGHLAGDTYLCRFSEWVQDCLGQNGILYRVGGDEFIALYTGEDTVSLQKKLSDPYSGGENGQPPFLGVSFGVVASCDYTDMEKMLSSADRLMYESKAAKR